ncbi:lipase [Intrasporangium oryzae NRRL B-24470]|uniref:Lipase n=1 Tax=Intrasporangium oryzae NRRL B-24470 TaxID=1386089 RepID=W9G9G6_9MICO|nr:alpha/beta fold hydrolase [Intrasporangium oryzae]EWT02841.1 lipase [Intrasporangium oryzae NRRL B-24470]
MAARAARTPQPGGTPDGDAGSPRGVLASIGAAAGALLTPVGIVGAAVEATWMTLHLGLYPLGLLGARATDRRDGYRLEHLPPSQRGLAIRNVEAAETPILLVHGMVDNRSIFTVLRRGLVRRGFGRIETMNYSIFTGDVRAAAARLGAEVERIVEETGYERIHVIGHSMGGLIARYYVTRLGGDAHVHTLVTLGTPHHGSYLAMAWNTSLTRQLRPGSGLMTELAQPVKDCQTRFIAYWSDLDQVILPQCHAALHHPDLNVHNIALHGVGHMSLPVTSSVVRGISTALAHLDVTGATVTPGVSQLRTRRTSLARPSGTSGTAQPGVPS